MVLGDDHKAAGSARGGGGGEQRTVVSINDARSAKLQVLFEYLGAYHVAEAERPNTSGGGGGGGGGRKGKGNAQLH